MTTSIRNMTDWAELQRLLASQPGEGRRVIREDEMKAALESRVKGQGHVIEDLVRLIRLQWAKQSRQKPIANILFLGPTGMGKTEMAKALASYLYGSDDALLRFDCSELSGPESKNHLIGNPDGYVGEGGKLTRPMLNNPKRVVLFDEIEKAYRPVLDLFLQVLGEARLTEPASGKVANFTEAIVVLTTNLAAEQILKINAEVGDYHERANAIKTALAATGEIRPEILGRIDRIYVFQPLEGMVIAEIAIQKMSKAASEYGLQLLHVDPRLVFQAMQQGNKLSRFGVRELERVINDMLGAEFVKASEEGLRRVRLEVSDTGEIGIAAA